MRGSKAAKITFSTRANEDDGFDGASLRGKESQKDPSPSPEWIRSRPRKRCWFRRDISRLKVGLSLILKLQEKIKWSIRGIIRVIKVICDKKGEL